MSMDSAAEESNAKKEETVVEDTKPAELPEENNQKTKKKLRPKSLTSAKRNANVSATENVAAKKHNRKINSISKKNNANGKLIRTKSEKLQSKRKFKEATAPAVPTNTHVYYKAKVQIPAGKAARFISELAVPDVQAEEKKEETNPAVMAVFSRVLSGHFQDIPTPLSKLVRVFTSSTFTDTTLERNALMEDVYPDLKRYCREVHGLDFQVVDMRWGVRDEATDDHMITNLCINEIHNCQRLSTGANFVVFLCQKYGYRPIPSDVLSSELSVLKRVLQEQKAADLAVLDTWFIEDLNAVPSRFILQPISSVLVNFNNKRIPKLQEHDAKAWWEIEAKMQNLLRKGAKLCYECGYFTYDEMHNYFMSITEREVIHGILNAENPNENCLCYVRHMNNIDISQPNVASKYIDIVNKEINAEAQTLLANLRDERVPAKLHIQNIRRSTVDWMGREGMDTQGHAQYLKEFCSDFHASITNMVDVAMRKQAKYRDVFFVEVLQHLWNATQGSNLFFGREAELQVTRNYLRDASLNAPLIFYGEHGCGKTSMLAKIATLVRTWLHGEDDQIDYGTEAVEENLRQPEQDFLSKLEPVLILRFLGTSPDSSSIAPLLIAYNYNPALRNQCPMKSSKLFQHFKKMIALATKHRPLIIILDSLDLLSKMDASEELLWFPPILPPNVKLIASLSSNTAVETNMHQLVESESQYVFVPALGPELGMVVLRNWLQSIGRTITDRQSELVGKALAYCTLPLFLKLVYATVARWKSYSKPQETVLFKSVQQSIHALFDWTESQHGKLLVSHALSYITAAKSGISDSELEDLISLDDKVLDDIYQYHLPPVRRIPPLLWSRIRADLPGYLSERAADGVVVLNWYHEQFRTAANERYFKNLNHLQSTHSAIADYFLGIWGEIPKPYQYTDLQKQRFGVTENEGLADRKVPKQPNMFRGKDTDKVRYNTRKLNELSYHLLRARRLNELFTLCLFNFEFLQAKLCSFPLQLVVADYEDAIGRVEDADTCLQLGLVVDALRLSASLLSKYPYMLAVELLGRLLPLVPANNHLKTLLCGCDIVGPQFNAFLPIHHCFHSPGGPLKYSLEEHPFAVFGMQLSANFKNLASTSNQLIVWDVQTGDLTRIINPNIEGIFLGMTLSADDRVAAAYTNNNQVVIMSLITGEFNSVNPDGMEQQMAIEHITFTDSQQILIWSATQYQLYNTKGRFLHRGLLTEFAEDGEDTVLVYVFFKSVNSLRVLAKNSDRDNWNVSVYSKEGAKHLQKFIIAASLTFFDNELLHGPVISNLNTKYAIITFEMDRNSGAIRVLNVLAENMEDKANMLIFYQTYCKVRAEERNWLIAVTVDNFILTQNLNRDKLVQLKLPADVRNIPIKPMHSTSAVTLCCGDTVFVAGIRKNLYIWNVNSAQLVRTVDAHFGRILNLNSLTLNNNNLLISSSIDRSIKIWNMENIFEKSFSLHNMDQAIEKILIAKRHNNLAIAQTRKYLGVWDVRSHRFITSLVTNAYGSVVTDCMITNDGHYVVCIESDNLMVWDLKTQTVNHRLAAPNVHQILFLDGEKYIGVVYRQTDAPEMKLARLCIYKMPELVLLYTHDYACRNFKNVIVLKDTTTVVLVSYFKNHDYLHVVDVRERCMKHRFKLKKQDKDITIQGLIVVTRDLCVVMDGKTHGTVWDVKARKLIRTLQNFTGICTQDGKLGLHAPSRGGLHVIDMKTGNIVRTLIGNVAEGVNDVRARFTPNGAHVLYYHSGHQTLRAFRVADAQHIGTLRAHAQITTWTCDHNGEKVIIGGQDGSLITMLLHDSMTFPNIQRTLASMPSRKYLAEHLQLNTTDLNKDDSIDLRNLSMIIKAIAKFKQPLKSKKKGSVVCSIQ